MKTFAELNLSAPLMQALAELKFEVPSAIQAQTLPLLLGQSTDFIGLAATGTGKTAAFSIPLLEAIDPKLKKLQGLILCPTRELALQVSEQINLLGKHLKIRALPIYGGTGYNDQIYGLKAGANVVVGTPGRLIDHLEKGTLKLDDLKTLILDEADEMISMGFKEDLEALLKASPREKSRIWLFSATMNREVRRVADTYLKNPKHVQVNKNEMLSSTVEQIYFNVREHDKPEVICKLIDAAESFYGLIFCQTKALVADMAQYLYGRGYKVDSLHGDKDQTSRERTMMAFRNRRVNILVCTDVASRGLDVKDITHVINFSIPRELDNYVHRIGRTARSGKSGLAMSLVTPMNRGLIPRIEKMTNSRMREGRIPTQRDILEKKVNQILAQFKAQKAPARASDFLSPAWKAELESMDPAEVAGRFLSMNFPGVFEALEGPKPQPVTTQVRPAPAHRPSPRPAPAQRPTSRPDYAKPAHASHAKPAHAAHSKPSRPTHAKPGYARPDHPKPRPHATAPRPKPHVPARTPQEPKVNLPAGNRAERRKHLQQTPLEPKVAGKSSKSHAPWTVKGKKAFADGKKK